MAKDLNFQHSYFTEEKKKNDSNGMFSSKFTSYISDGSASLKDKTLNNATREQVMSQVRANLVNQMNRANDASASDARDMKERHRSLHGDMIAALNAAKEAARNKKVNEAKLKAENAVSDVGNQAGQEIDQDIELISGYKNPEHVGNQEPDQEQDQNQEKNANRIEIGKIDEDIAKLNEARDLSEVNSKKNRISKGERKEAQRRKNRLEDQIRRNDLEIAERTEFIRQKAREWNETIRKDYRETKFRKQYDAYDQAAFRYHMLSRKKREGEQAARKNISEYVGAFDMESLNRTLDQMPDNPYYQAQIAFKNYKDYTDAQNARTRSARQDAVSADLIKTHDKITAYSEEDEEGNVRRYKLNSEFKGYLAKRQIYVRDDDTTGLDVMNEIQNEINEKDSYAARFGDSAGFKLKVDERDYRNNFINSEDNIEIRTARKGKWYNKKKVNGVFLNGQFISTEVGSVNGNKEYSLGMIDTWAKAAEREKIRRAVLKSSIFNMINSGNIQRAAGYGAAGSAKAGEIRKKLISEIADKYKNDFKAENEENLSDEDKTKAREEKVTQVLFSQEYENELIKKKDNQPADNNEGNEQNGNNANVVEYENPGQLPAEKARQWEQILSGNDAQKIKDIPSAVKTKVLYDVLRQESVKIGDVLTDGKLKTTNKRVSKLISGVKSDKKALVDVALLLLSDDTKTEYWDVAKALCTEVMGGRFKHAVEKARAEKGQLMRVALIDELNAQRSRFTFNDPFWNLVATDNMKINRESFEARRGAFNKITQKLMNGSLENTVTGIFSGVVNMNKGLDAAQVGWGRMMDIYSFYASTVTAAWEFGAIPDMAAYQISYLKGPTEMKEDGTYPQDARRLLTSQILTIIKNVYTLVKAVKKCYDTKKAEIKAGPDSEYAKKEKMALLQNKWFTLCTSLVNVGLTITATTLAIKDQMKDSAIVGMVQNAIAIIQSSLEIAQGEKKKGAIKNLEKKYKTAMSNVEADEQEQKMKELEEENEEEIGEEVKKNINLLQENAGADIDEKDITKILRNNSQLQYGLSCAKRKIRNDRAGKIFGIITNAGKFVINGLRAIVPDKISKFILNGADALWTATVSGISTVTEIVRDKLAIKANLEKMLGKEFRSVNVHQLNSVLRREAGIVDSNYLTDLARIFMSIDTHVFMQEAADNKHSESESEKEQKKKMGLEIAQALFANDKYEYRDVDKEGENGEDKNAGKLKKVKVGDLMGAYGVAGNFHLILKHSLQRAS